MEVSDFRILLPRARAWRCATDGAWRSRCATTIVAAVFQLLIPQLSRPGRRHARRACWPAATRSPARAALWQAAALLLGAAVLRGLFTMWHNYQGEAVGQRLAYDLRMAYYAQLQRLSFGFHDRVHTGELITRGMLDIEGIRMVINAGADPPRAVQRSWSASGAALLLSREPAARPDRAQLRPVRRLALGGGAAAAARQLARAPGKARRADPRHGGEPRRHPRGPRLRRATP